MSAICLVNLKDHTLSFEKLNNLAKELVKYSLENNLGVFFNTTDYGYDIIESGSMRNYFLLSDSFLYENCEFLEESYLLALGVKSNEEVQKRFLEKFSFFDQIIKILFQNDITIIEIYISEYGTEETAQEFTENVTTKDKFLEKLYNTFVNSEDVFTFPPVKFVIKK